MSSYSGLSEYSVLFLTLHHNNKVIELSPVRTGGGGGGGTGRLFVGGPPGRGGAFGGGVKKRGF